MCVCSRSASAIHPCVCLCAGEPACRTCTFSSTEAEELYQRRVLTITGICVALLVVGIVCVVAYCKTKYVCGLWGAWGIKHIFTRLKSAGVTVSTTFENIPVTQSSSGTRTHTEDRLRSFCLNTHQQTLLIMRVHASSGFVRVFLRRPALEEAL